jgi:hypothetical protein
VLLADPHPPLLVQVVVKRPNVFFFQNFRSFAWICTNQVEWGVGENGQEKAEVPTMKDIWVSFIQVIFSWNL